MSTKRGFQTFCNFPIDNIKIIWYYMSVEASFHQVYSKMHIGSIILSLTKALYKISIL